MANHPIPSWRVLREPAVIAATGYSRASLHRLAAAGTFPRPIKLGEGRGGAIGWREDDIHEWLDARQAGRPWAERTSAAQAQG